MCDLFTESFPLVPDFHRSVELNVVNVLNKSGTSGSEGGPLGGAAGVGLARLGRLGSAGIGSGLARAVETEQQAIPGLVAASVVKVVGQLGEGAGQALRL
jgi:hypothetical protein